MMLQSTLSQHSKKLFDLVRSFDAGNGMVSGCNLGGCFVKQGARKRVWAN